MYVNTGINYSISSRIMAATYVYAQTLSRRAKTLSFLLLQKTTFVSAYIGHYSFFFSLSLDKIIGKLDFKEKPEGLFHSSFHR